MLSDTVRVGRQMGFSRSRIVDADDHTRLIALSEGMGVSLGGTPEGFAPVENPPIDVVDSPDLPPLHRVFGATRRPDGWVLPELTLELASPDAALHLGPIHVVLETAATEAAGDLAGTDAVQIEDWHVMFVARGDVYKRQRETRSTSRRHTPSAWCRRSLPPTSSPIGRLSTRSGSLSCRR